MKEIIVFSIGPVQSFIAAARRTQDLWTGSRLLSSIMAHALDQAPADGPVFPRRQPDGAWPESLPNRAVLIVPPEQGKTVAEQMEGAGRERWMNIANAVKAYFGKVVIAAEGDTDWSAIWDRQVGHWLEVYWAVYPWDEGHEPYGVAYRAASEQLDARKLLRHSPSHEEYDVKSTLDGAYQALRGPGKARDAQWFWNRAWRVAPRGPVRRGERLSAIDLVKRFAQDAGQLPRATTRFPSTSAIATADYRLALAQQWDKTGPTITAFVAALDALVAAFPNQEEREQLRFAKNSTEPIASIHKATEGPSQNVLARLARYDGDYFYPEFYTEARLLESAGREPNAKLSETERTAMDAARSALRDLYRCTDELKIPRPGIYYSIIALDGDRMGARLSHPGMSEAVHRRISAAMAAFAQEDVPRIAGADFPAIWVYAGGDDALVLAPAARSLEIAEALRLAFAKRVGPLLREVEPDEVASVSAGIAIVHQQNPLQTGIERARRAERDAKNSPHDRNALVVRRLTRGGSLRQTGGKWTFDLGNGPQSLVELITQLQGHIAADKLSGKFAYELRDEADALTVLPPTARAAELGRLLKRHTPKKHWDEVLPLAEQLAALAQTWSGAGMVRVADWAVVARFLALGGRNE